VTGFALEWPGQEHGALWITGDTVLYDGVRRVADRLRVDTAILHLGCDEGWTHFHQGRDAIERVFAQAPTDIRRSIRWLPIGVGVTT
jgi:hypothetical protein